jgi:hypothetical protein
MSQGRFANQRALIDCAEAHDLAYAWQGSNVFAKRWRLAQAAQPDSGISKALLFPRAILRAEHEAERPFREAMAIKRERLQAKRAAKQRST